MRKRGFKKTILTMATVFCMVMSAPVNALAAGVEVVGETKTVESVTTTDEIGASVASFENERSVLHVKKGVTVDSKNEMGVRGLYFDAEMNAYAEAVVEQDVNVHASKSCYASGIEFNSGNKGEVNATVNNISVKNEYAESGDATCIDSFNENGRINANINGNMKADALSGFSELVDSRVFALGSSEIIISGDGVASGRDVNGIDLYNSVESEEGVVPGSIENSVHCKGSLTLKAEEEVYGISESLQCGSTYVGVDGNVTLNGKTAHGFNVGLGEEKTGATVEVGGNLNVNGTEYADGFVMLFSSVGEKTVRASVKGDVSVSSKQGNSDGFFVSFPIHEDLSEGKKTFSAVVDGNITVESEYARAASVIVEDTNADANVYLRTGGNLTGTKEGIFLWNVEGKKVDFLVEGTLSATNGPALVLYEETSDICGIAAWKVASGEDYELVMETLNDNPADEEYTHTSVSKKAEKNINYLIKVAPEQKEYFVFDESIQKTWGELADEEITYPCAHEGEKVFVKVQNIPKGYVVSKVYADAEKKLLMAKEAEDTYSFIMPKGGGVTVNMELEPAPLSDVNVLYSSHIESVGWEEGVKKNGQVSGTIGEGKRLEAINISVEGNKDLGIQYTTHVQDLGWMNWSADGEMSGTTGESKRMEAVVIQLTGEDKDKYDVYYRVHVQGYGWMNWAVGGQPAGTTGFGKRLEALQIVVVKKGDQVPSDLGGITSANEQAYISAGGMQPVIGGTATNANAPEIAGADNVNVVYRTHVQTYGWQNWKGNGDVSGTMGQSKRVEAISLQLSNKDYAGGIEYSSHVQGSGWQGYVDDGRVSGTSGQSRRLEAVRIRLTGEMADHYDVYYRVHSQTYGWLGWASNGAPAGTEGHSKRMEALEVVVVEKGEAAPGNTENSFVK